MIVEGQAEYLIVRSLARSLGYDFDEHGISVIDAQNNGKPSIFAALARALGIPWLAVFDGDEAGHSYVQEIKTRGIDSNLCFTLPEANLEKQLLADGLEKELRTILETLGQSDAITIDIPTLEKRLSACKGKYAAELALRLVSDSGLTERMPKQYHDAIEILKALT